MAYCQKCEGKISDGETQCPHCGEKIIPADQLEKLPGKITGWQKFVIAVSIVILVAIALTFQGAEQREDRAAEENFIGTTRSIIYAVSEHGGLTAQFGQPEFKLVAKTHGARVYIEFPRGGLTQGEASMLGQSVAASLARAYVKKGYAPRHIEVTIASRLSNRRVIYYGTSFFNGDTGKLYWTRSGRR